MAINYPDAKHQNEFERGLEFQDFAQVQLAKIGITISYFVSRRCQYERGESLQGVEVKLDDLCTTTGRLSIEIAEKSKASNPTFAASGIYREDNTWLYVQGNYQRLFVFAKKHLRSLHLSGKFQEHQTLTLKAFYLPIARAESLSVHFLLFDKSKAPDVNTNAFLDYWKTKQKDAPR